MSRSAVTNLRVVPGELRPELTGLSIQQMEIESVPLGGGGFGANYPCLSLNGAPSPLPLLIKILKDDGKGSLAHARQTVRELMARLKVLDTKRRRSGASPLFQVPALLAVPQFWFEGQWNGQTVCGYGAVRLDTLGYRPFDRFTDGDPARTRLYRTTPTKHRFRMAADFAEGMHLLSEVGFLHGDLNPENLFIHLKDGHLAIIDFDSGGIDGQPGTWGKPTSDWIAPEIIAALAAGNLRPKVTPESDAWSLGIGIHYLICLFHPLAYLKDLGGQTLSAYFQRERWPNLRSGSPLAHPINGRGLPRYIHALTHLPRPAYNLFDEFLNAGTLNPANRPVPLLWQQAFQGQIRPPTIQFFTADHPVILPGQAVTLAWWVDNAAQVELVGVGDVIGTSQLSLAPSKATNFTLIARGIGGETRRTVAVNVIQPPEVIPALPSPSLSLSTGLPCSDQIITLAGMDSGLPPVPPMLPSLPILSLPSMETEMLPCPVFTVSAPPFHRP
jgi:serine/threonine protein kinase